jgi:hypothetical protein
MSGKRLLQNRSIERSLMPPFEKNDFGRAQQVESRSQSVMSDFENAENLDASDERPKRARNPRKIFKSVASEFFKQFRAIKSNEQVPRASTAKHDDKQNAEMLADELSAILQRSLSAAIQKADIDVDDFEDVDWKLLMFLLAHAIYGGEGPGRKKSWDDGKLRRLFQDYEAANVGDPQQRTEQAICKELCSRKSNFPQYHSIRPSTIRRRLQEAKSLLRREAAELKVAALLPPGLLRDG